MFDLWNFTKQNLTHTVNESGKKVDNEIIWQHISNGANFVNYQIILNSLNKMPNIQNKDNYLEKAQANLGESIQYIQNTIMGECQKVDITEYVKTK